MGPSEGRRRVELTFPADLPEEEKHRRISLHIYTALTEGVCPYCGQGLEVAEGDSADTPGTGLPWGRCRPCRCFWQLDLRDDDPKWTWEADWAWLGLGHPGRRPM